jgi:hypothetical protein
MSSSQQAELVSVTKIWDQAPHNAFTDLVRFKNRWICTFRESDMHVYGINGRIRVLESDDGHTWRSAALLAEEGFDLREGELSITPNGRLMKVGCGSVYEGEILKSFQSRVFFSNDGRTWTKPQPVLTEGQWLWRVAWHDGTCYGITKGYVNATKVLDGKPRLVASTDGVNWETIAHLDVTGQPTETAVRFKPDGTMIALVRREGGTQNGWIGVSRPPYTQWKWSETAHPLGGPNFIILPDGSMIAGTRSYPGGWKTMLCRMSETSLDRILTLPSDRDCSYTGLVWHDGLLWVTYYSMHEADKACIYLAKVRLEQ